MLQLELPPTPSESQLLNMDQNYAFHQDPFYTFFPDDDMATFGLFI